MSGLRVGTAPRPTAAGAPGHPDGEPPTGPGTDGSGTDGAGHRPDDGAGYRPDDGAVIAAEAAGPGPGGGPGNLHPQANGPRHDRDPGNPHPPTDGPAPGRDSGRLRSRADGIGRRRDGGPPLHEPGPQPGPGAAAGLRSVLPGGGARAYQAPVGDAREGGTASVDGTWSADPYARALRTGRGPLFLRRADGWLLPLELERWCAAADAADLEVLRRCEGAVLDVGCGPGRLVAALGARGRRVLGIDVSDAAVARTVALGGQALRRSVFESLPGEGRWGTALLIDGNIGIGGDPTALLARTRQLLAPGGLLIAETVTEPDLDERVRVHVTDARGAVGDPFPWARLGTPALLRYADRADWTRVDQWTAGGRSFVALRRRTTKSTAEAPKSTAVTSSQRARKPSGDRPVAEA